MKREYFIGVDVHCQWTDLVVVTQSGRVTRRWRCATTIPALRQVIETIPRPRYLAFEEGPLADWLFRNLTSTVDQITVCDPRRNHLIAKESDKDDSIDAEKLAQLLRGGYLKPVHHPDSFDRAVFKHHVGLYHDSVHRRVEQANRVMAYLRRYGVFVRESAFAHADTRPDLINALPKHPIVRSNVQLLWQGYDCAARQVRQFRRRLLRLARRDEQIRRFVQLPGVLWIRAATFVAYIDTPWRFQGKSALWRYMGIGLERHRSGTGPAGVRLSYLGNRTLKNMILGAAKSAVAAGDNPFADQYERSIHEGTPPRIGRRNVARSLAVTMWGMWKNGSVYHPEWVGQAVQPTAPIR